MESTVPSPWILHGVMLTRNGVFRMDTIRSIRRRVFRLLSGVVIIITCAEYYESVKTAEDMKIIIKYFQ